MKPKIDFIYIDAGGGHRAAAAALAEVIQEQQRPWDLQFLCIQDLLESIDVVRKSVGIPFQDLYNLMLRRHWTLGTAQLVPVMHLAIRLFHRSEVEVLTSYWAAHRPDMVVSLIPHYNRALKEALDQAWPGTPFVTILTDIADYPPNFWIEPMDQHVICGSGRAVEQALGLGLPESHIVRTSGMIVNPRFYRPAQLDRSAERVRLGLKPDLPTGLVLFGGEGSLEMPRIAKALSAAGHPLQLIFICGRNRRALQALRELPGTIPIHAEGFTHQIPYFMALSDFMIGKPGPGSISEALVMGLPVIVECNAWTLAHERYNADWIEEQNAGKVVRSLSQIAGAVQALLEPEQYRRYRASIAANHNTAVFEIPGILHRILAGAASATPPDARLIPANSSAENSTPTGL